MRSINEFDSTMGWGILVGERLDTFVKKTK